MIINAQTWQTIKTQAFSVLARRDVVLDVMRRPAFQGAFKHGLSIFAGVCLGLIIWTAAQKTPDMPRYALTASIPEPTKPSVPVATSASPAKSAPSDHAAPAKVTLPLPGLTEDKPPYGALPIVRTTDELRPFDAYRRPFAAGDLDKPLIALAMLDYGLSVRDSKSVLGVMPAGINLILSRAARDATTWSQQAYDHGHEVWLDLATEPADYPLNDPGAHALMTSASIEKNQESLLHQLGHAVGYAGVFAADPGPYFASGADADFAAGIIFARGLGLMVNAPDTATIARSAANEARAPLYAAPMTVMDHAANYESAFRQAERNAKEKGYAIVLFRPLPPAQKAVMSWIETLKAKGYALAPLSIIAERGAELAP